MSERGEDYLQLLKRETGMGVSSLKFKDIYEEEYHEDLVDIYGNMTINEMNLAFLKMIGPHVNRLQTLDISRESYGGHSDDIEPVLKIIPPSLVNLTLLQSNTDEIERVLECTLPNLAKFTFSLDFPDNWAYKSRSDASENVEAFPRLRKAIMLVADCGGWEDKPGPPSAMDTASWLADILPFDCNLTVKHNPELMCCGHCAIQPWIHRWMVDIEKFYRFHRTTMGKSG
jgi:hypothetical protein